MRKILIKTIQIGILAILVYTFIIAIVVGIFIWKQPQFVVQLVEQLHPTPTPVAMQVKGIGVLGDSQSDEYRADDHRGDNYPSTTLSWVELLAQKRKINFGVWGSYKEPRRTGYEYNWARSGATARSMIESGQHIGIAEQIKQGKINVVILSIGANDYAPFITDDGYGQIYSGELTEANMVKKRNRFLADVKTALDVIKKAGDAKILLVKIPDWGNNFGIQMAFPIPNQRARVTEAIAETNNELEKLAEEYQIPTVDPNEFYQKVMNNAEASKLRIGNVTMERLLLNNDPRNMFLEDGIHPGTVLNGLFANEIINTMHTQFGTQVKPFTHKEVLDAAGLQ